MQESTVAERVPPGTTRSQRVGERAANVAAFLAGRDMEPAWLEQVMTTAVGPGELLLTSSPVHGLANATSDVDVIRVTDEEVTGPRIATKLFDRDHHLEVVSFTRDEVAANLRELARLAQLPPVETVAAARAWDRTREPRRKQTERIVNGVTFDGRMPYADALDDLSVVWARVALHTAVEHVSYLALAEAAGETRGRVGYATNAVLQLADALLSFSGDVYTTRKWVLLRWVRAALPATGDPLATAVDDLRSGLTAAYRDPAPPPLTPRYAEVLDDVARALLGTARVGVTWRLHDDVTVHDFLAGSVALVGPRSSVVVPAADLAPRAAGPLDVLAESAPVQARAMLAALRAGVAGLSVDYVPGSTDHEEVA